MNIFEFEQRLERISQLVEALAEEKRQLEVENRKLMLENDYLRDKVNLLEEISIQLRSCNDTYRKVLNGY